MWRKIMSKQLVPQLAPQLAPPLVPQLVLLLPGQALEQLLLSWWWL
jgi:hypothetical protein